MVIAGIDIGLKGSLALIKNNKVIFKDFKDNFLRGYISVLQEYKPELVIIEKVHAMPNQGVKSMFSFGQRLGEIEGMLQALNLSYELVSPKLWQKSLDISAKSSKQEIADCVLKRYPGAELYGKKGGLLDGRSDALGLLHYGVVKYVQSTKAK